MHISPHPKPVTLHYLAKYIPVIVFKNCTDRKRGNSMSGVHTLKRNDYNL